LQSTISLRRHGEGLGELMLVSAYALAYFGIRHVTEGDWHTAVANARRVQRLEHALGLNRERALQAAVLGHPALVTLCNWVYIFGHWPVIITVAVALHRYRPDRYLLLRNAVFASGAIGFLFFAFFPVAPPRLAEPGLVDTITVHSHAYRGLQPPALTNEVASFPSLHFGWDLLAGIAVFGATGSLLLRALAVAAPAAMAAAVVLTANHYVVDVLGGLLVVLLALAVHLAVTGRRRQVSHAGTSVRECET
jgi:membrane-associated phospholipid phosphatase